MTIAAITFIFTLVFSACGDGPIEVADGRELLLTSGKVSRGSNSDPVDDITEEGWTTDLRPGGTNIQNGTWTKDADDYIVFIPGENTTNNPNTYQIQARYFPRSDKHWLDAGLTFSPPTDRLPLESHFRQGILAFDIKINDVNKISSQGEISAEILGQETERTAGELWPFAYVKWNIRRDYGLPTVSDEWYTYRLDLTDGRWGGFIGDPVITHVFRFGFTILGMADDEIRVTIRNVRFIEQIEN